ncbi:hypothetical protein CY34DRAFT_804701 [Suillus luteus UH-Slu-Lm8-n1]|uniref:Uncharacterized protein n=1 Tax=Suillus luteus UH-Slu-Lm8-n1 TaxID=930992 RepID=A0A0D0BHH7_9AGAM|nr:hypothetical protein CY34DRAFT_804701 [Suillus luteus UH-Slu-Lm8-n1]
MEEIRWPLIAASVLYVRGAVRARTVTLDRLARRVVWEVKKKVANQVRTADRDKLRS